jgi:transposase
MNFDMKNVMKKKPHSTEFKFKVAIECIIGEKTSLEICQEYGIVSSQLFKWKKAFLEHGKDIFKNGNPSNKTNEQQAIEKLHALL